MNKGYAYLIVAVALMMLTGCDVREDMDVPVQETKEIMVNMSKASGMKAQASDPEYALRFWTGSIAGSWGMTVGAGYVDNYNYGGQNLAVTGGLTEYPHDNTPIYAVGYYPAGKVVVSQTSGVNDYGSLTLKTQNGDGTTDWMNLPGLIDVCTTDVEVGTEKDPFTVSEDHELQFRHTQVKLNFRYKRSKNLNGRIAQIWVTMPETEFANKWTYTEPSEGKMGGYLPSYTPEGAENELIFSSTEDWYQSVPKEEGYDMFYSYFTDPADKANYTVTGLKDMYVMPSQTLFGPKEIMGMQVQHLTFLLNAVTISSQAGVSYERIQDRMVSVPLRKKEDGSFWTDTVKAGDAFTITLTIEQNRLELWAEKIPWEEGGRIIIPLNPNNPGEHSNGTTTPTP